MPFLTEAEPPRGVALDVLPGIRRIVARNPSVMTYLGTNTYLIETESRFTVLDPGPEDAQHVRDILQAVGEKGVSQIVLTHTHPDHFGAVPMLRAETGAPVYAYKAPWVADFVPDQALDDGDAVAGLIGVFTPGHAPDHLCFEYAHPSAGKILFSGDHVMSWSSSIVSPPGGDMLDYYRSLDLMLQRDDDLYLPGHGPVLPEPRTLVAELLAHRQRREMTILRELAEQPWVVASLAGKLYNKAEPRLKRAAERNVLAHMLKLLAEERVAELAPAAASDLPEEPGAVGSLAMRADALRRFALRPTG